MNTKSPQLNSLQALRALAALLVLIFHLFRAGEKYFGDSPLGVFRYGYTGVDLFFVISGFIITYISYPHLGKLSYAQTFFYRRVIRIYPIYWQFSLCALAMYLLQPYWVNTAHTNKPDILRSFLLLPQENTLLLMVGWSLVYEMFFYLVFLLFFLLPRQCFLPALLLWGIYSAQGVGYSKDMSSYAALLRSDYCLYFIGGCLTALATQRKTLGARAMLYLGAMGWISAMAVHFAWDIPRALHVALFCISAMMMIYGCVTLEKQQQLTTPKWLISLGDASYSLYLLHPLVIAAVGPGLSTLWGDAYVAQAAFLLLVLVFSISGALLNYRYIERPLIKKLTKKA